jgi:hypothetical protein
MNMPQISVRCANVTDIETDVLGLKYAQAFHGADASVARQLRDLRPDFSVRPGSYASFVSNSVIAARHILFVGVPELHRFTYGPIRAFGRDAVRFTAKEFPAALTLTLTIHGVGYGLDERESFLAQLGGIFEAFESHEFGSLKQVVIVERNPERAKRLAVILDSAIGSTGRAAKGKGAVSTTVDAGVKSEAKRHVFVAMPFNDEMQDVFEFGIKDPINACGLLCERVDMAVFTGDILERIKERISSASLVVADLTTSNANVFLEVGYAWGKGTPTLLVARTGEQLKFDVKTQRVVFYPNIRELKKLMEHDLKAMLSGR